MFLIQELPDDPDVIFGDAACYFGGYRKDGYGTQQPVWTRNIHRARRFDSKAIAELLAHDFTDLFRWKYDAFTTFVVVETSEEELAIL